MILQPGASHYPMDKLTKRHKNEITKDDPIIITLEEGRDFHCISRRKLPEIDAELLLKKNN